ncbi:PQQ-binding-like beta-propeller repeat protein [Streptomyces orinoci]|uniref:PQQ-binding-like beta-propeller repeat protein n=1 Tax=Streptomyces orinoci TaxID=67339 RepID=A0ABV3K7L5_STRON|nr:PQQ-binding-like beta-propeller repeat protein [Streptomyces orinoci]
MVLASMVTALALAAAGGIWTFTQDGGGSHGSANHSSSKTVTDEPKRAGKPKPINGRLLLSLDEPLVPGMRPTAGLWVTDYGFVKTGLAQVTGYGPTGGRKWDLPLDGEVCAASRHATPDGKVALIVRTSKANGEVAIDAGDHCTEVVLLDLGTGRKLWQKQARSGDHTFDFRQVTVGGSTVAAGGPYGGAAWSLNDGRELWKPKPEDTCHDISYGSDGGKLVAMRICDELEDPRYSVQTLRPNGAVASKFLLPRGLKSAYVVSAAPLVITINANDSSGNDVSDLMVIDDSARDGKLRAKISMANGGYVASCVYIIQNCGNLVVNKGSLYVATRAHQTTASGAQGNEIVEFDLSNGQPKGKTASAEGTWLSPVNVDGEGNLIAYQRADADSRNAVMSISPGTFTAIPLLKLPEKSRRSLTGFRSDTDWILWSPNRLYLGRDFIQKPCDKEDPPDYLVEVWGAD